METGSSWFVVQTKPWFEKIAANSLQMKGYEVFLPHFIKRKQRRNQITTIQCPLFPGYLFCRLAGPVFGKVLLTPGVRRFVAFGGSPVPIATCEIEWLQKLQASNIMHSPWQYIPTGTRVRIISGPLCGIDGILLHSDHHRHLIISVDILQRSVSITLDDLTVLRALPQPMGTATGDL
jgi:transcription elongation factor/antiterminator RfaH